MNRYVRCAALGAAMILCACATGPKTEAELKAAPQNMRASEVAGDPKTMHGRIAEFARKCWDDAEMSAQERENKRAGAVFATIFAGPLAGASAATYTQKVEAGFDEAAKSGRVRAFASLYTGTSVGIIIETADKGPGTEVRTYASHFVERLHATSVRWANGEKTCEGYSKRQIQ